MLHQKMVEIASRRPFPHDVSSGGCSHLEASVSYILQTTHFTDKGAATKHTTSTSRHSSWVWRYQNAVQIVPSAGMRGMGLGHAKVARFVRSIRSGAFRIVLDVLFVAVRLASEKLVSSMAKKNGWPAYALVLPKEYENGPEMSARLAK